MLFRKRRFGINGSISKELHTVFDIPTEHKPGSTKKDHLYIFLVNKLEATTAEAGGDQRGLPFLGKTTDW